MSAPVSECIHGCGPDAPVTLEMSFPCPPGTKPVDEAQVRRVDDFYCASLIHTGALAHLGEAYDALLRSMQQAGLTPGNEGRELYLRWKEGDSPNNVTMIQLAIASSTSAQELLG